MRLVKCLYRYHVVVVDHLLLVIAHSQLTVQSNVVLARQYFNLCRRTQIDLRACGLTRLLFSNYALMQADLLNFAL